MKKIILTISFNLILFLMMVIGIQNSSKKEKVYFLNNESIKLPVSFIIGISFISGSLTGSFFNLNQKKD